jgi:hypothetical protein
MSVPTCPYCERAFGPTGCEYLDDDPRPLPYGDETDAYADLRGLTAAQLTAAPTCWDCGVARGKLHHPDCLKSECGRCHGQFGLCGGVDCEEGRRWRIGEGGRADAA